MKPSVVSNAVKRSTAAIVLLIGLYIFTTAGDLSKMNSMLRINTGYSGQASMLIAIGAIVVSVIELCAAQISGANYFASVGYLILSVGCLCCYMSYEFYKDMILFSIVFAIAAIVLYIMAKRTPEAQEPSAGDTEDTKSE